MATTNLWYQMGGYGGHTNRFRNPPLNRWFMYSLHETFFLEGTRPRPCLTDSAGRLLLTLGIDGKGCSSLLITKQQLLDLLSDLRLDTKYIMDFGTPFPSSRYESLSPFPCSTQEQLQTALKRLLPKQTGKRYDTSQLNKAYDMMEDSERSAIISRNRGAVEHSRLLWQSIYLPRLRQDLEVYFPGGRLEISGISTLAFTFWSPTQRTHEDTIVLDIGWSDITLEEIDGSVSERSNTTHMRIRDLESLQPLADAHRAKRFCDMPGDPSPTKMVTNGEAKRRIQEYFNNIITAHEAHPYKPHVLLIYDEAPTFQALKSFEVSTTDWEFGLRSLLRPIGMSAGGRDSYYRTVYSGSSPGPSRSFSSRDTREHSPPPRRGNSYDTQGPLRDSKKEIPPNDRDRRLFHSATPDPRAGIRRSPIVVLDLRSLYGTMTGQEILERQIIRGGISLRRACHGLDVIESPEAGKEPQGWCAGIDSEYLYEMWQSLSGGSPIDQRRDEVKVITPPMAPVQKKKSVYAVSADMDSDMDSDEESEDENINEFGEPLSAKPANPQL